MKKVKGFTLIELIIVVAIISIIIIAIGSSPIVNKPLCQIGLIECEKPH